MNRLEAVFTLALWLAAATLLPLAALAPVDRAEAGATATQACVNLVGATLRTCPASTL
jgi:hypothetical protein